jgi:thioredoxin reductase
VQCVSQQINGLFFAIGHEPASKFLDGQLDLDEDGYIKTTPGLTTTNVPGKMFNFHMKYSCVHN